ncbi:hypothetical protein [Nostoc sp.]
MSAGLVIYSTPPVVRRSPGTVTGHSESAKLKNYSARAKRSLPLTALTTLYSGNEFLRAK